MGVTRAEVKHKGSFGKGAEKWIHYAVRPMQNYFDQYRKKHISQCYASMPGDDEGFPMFFLDFRADFLWINLQQPMFYNTNLKQYVSDDVWAKLKSLKGKLIKILVQQNGQVFLVHFVNRADKDGLIEVFIDGSSSQKEVNL
jgi:tRNA nucleotidyltransferase (CCA-adding enzyme)